MNCKSYRAVFLDWDDTIGDFNGAAQKALQTMFRKYNLEEFYPDFDSFYAIYEPFNLYVWQQYGIGKMSIPELEHARFLHPLIESEKYKHLKTTAITEHLNTMADSMAADFLQLTTDNFSLLPDVEEPVKQLAERYPLTIVSNGFVRVQYKKILRSGLMGYFEHIILSEEVGTQKPQADIFRIALQRNNCKNTEAVMIGDSYTSDIKGAKNANIDQIWITSDTERDATYKVRNLRQAANLLLNE